MQSPMVQQLVSITARLGTQFSQTQNPVLLFTSLHCQPRRGFTGTQYAEVRSGEQVRGWILFSAPSRSEGWRCLKPSCSSPITLQTKSKDFAGPAKSRRTWPPTPPAPPTTHSLPPCHQSCCLLTDMPHTLPPQALLLLCPPPGTFLSLALRVCSLTSFAPLLKCHLFGED